LRSNEVQILEEKYKDVYKMVVIVISHVMVFVVIIIMVSVLFKLSLVIVKPRSVYSHIIFV